MSALATSDIFLFEGFRLDWRGLFRRDERGAFIPVAIGSRALDVLGVLVRRAGDLVSRDEIIAVVWPATVVEDSNLNMRTGSGFSGQLPCSRGLLCAYGTGSTKHERSSGGCARSPLSW